MVFPDQAGEARKRRKACNQRLLTLFGRRLGPTRRMDEEPAQLVAGFELLVIESIGGFTGSILGLFLRRFARFVLREVIEQAPSKQTALDLLPGLAPGGFGRRGPRMWREETPVMAAQFKHRFPLADFAVADHQRIFRQQQAPAQFFEIVQTDAAIVELRRRLLLPENALMIGDSKVCQRETMLELCRHNWRFLAPHPWTPTAKAAWRETWEKIEGGLLTWRLLDYLSQNEARKATEKQREKALVAGLAALSRLSGLVGKYHYRKRETITKRVDRDLAKAKASAYFKYTLTGTEGERDWRLQWERDQAAIAEEIKFDGISLMCTNTPESDLSANEVVSKYKEQIKVEQTIDFIKSPVELRPTWLHNPKRIAGLTLLIMIAVLVAMLLEYQVRRLLWGNTHLIKLGPQELSSGGPVGIDGRVLLFTLLVSLLTAVIFGLAPAWQTSKLNLTEALKEGSRNASAGRGWMRNLLVIGEIAMALILLVGAGLALKSFYRLLRVDPGFDPANVLTMRLDLSPVEYPEGRQQRAFYEQVLSRIESLSGVQAAGFWCKNSLTIQDIVEKESCKPL